jgi:pilus assembly protein CpaF
MYDKSRILAIRPPAGEFWAAFVRKFTLDKNTPIDLIMKPGIHKWELPVKFTEFLMKGKVTAAITGRQGTGKTTFLKAIVTYIDPKLNLRVLEMAPEMYLRELFPDRNIFSVHEINTVSLEEWQDAFKKSDAGVTIIGEIATDPVAARAIQLAMTGSIFTIFTHHANEAKDLVLTLRNSLVNAAGFDNMTTAERQVTEVLKMNIHFDITPDGKRYIKRITEIIQMEESIPYPEIDPYNVELSLANATIEHYQRTTDRISFETKDLLVYDLETDTYKAKDMPSDYIIQKILNGLHKDEQNEFCKFIDYYWKDISTEGYAGVNYESEMEHKSILTEEDISEDEALENISAYLRDRFNFGDDEE